MSAIGSEYELRQLQPRRPVMLSFHAWRYRFRAPRMLRVPARAINRAESHFAPVYGPFLAALGIARLPHFALSASSWANNSRTSRLASAKVLNIAFFASWLTACWLRSKAKITIA